MFSLNLCLQWFIWRSDFPIYHWLITSVQKYGDHLCIYCMCSLWEDSVLSILSLKPAICFACPIATFHPNDVRQVYGQPSLWRTIGSRVSPGPSLSETVQCHSWDEPCSPSTSAYWLKYLLAVPFLTCNLLLAAAEREPVDKSSLGLSMFYGYHILTTKLCLSVPSALGLNVKQPNMKGSLWREPCVFLLPAKWFNCKLYWAQQGKTLL